LEAFNGSIAVGEFRAVLPFARLNTVVQACFVLLFTPLACRLLAQNKDSQIAELYWGSVAWIAVLTFPVFAATTVLSPALATSLLGEEYASASVPMMLLAIGFFVEALLGLSGQVLRVYARVRYVVIADVTASVISFLLLLLLIPRYGAWGAALGTASFNVIAHGVYAYFSQAVTPVNGWAARGLRIYGSILLAILALMGLQHFLHPRWTGSMFLIVAAWFGLVVAHRRVLAVEQVVPGMAAFPRVCRLLGGASPSPANDAQETG
jgi:O-antigen/teichoic acid export membrane protein